MTDREKLIDFFMDELTEDHPWNGNIKGLVDKLIAAGATFQKWIPVTERLPEGLGNVLVCGERGGIYVASYGYRGWHKVNSKTHYCNPTHWMPLPEPPKEVDNA